MNEDILAALAALSLANSEVNTVSDKAAIKLERGTKRTCQNPECRERFYDLNRDPIPAQSVTTCMLLRSSLHRKYRRVFRQGRTRSGHLLSPTSRSMRLLAMMEVSWLHSGEEPVPVEEDDTLIDEVDVDSPDMEGIVDAPEADSNDKE